MVQVVETGYVLKERLLRPAKVGVSKGGPAAAKEEPAAAPEAEAEQKEGQAAYEDKGGEPGAKLDEKL